MKRSRLRLAIGTIVATLALAGIGSGTPAVGETRRELVGESTAQAFTIRLAADYGGASKLYLFFGSYADANTSNPPAGADGQASWYNLGIAETAAFTPPPPDPAACTPEEQQRRIEEASKQISEWVTMTAIPELINDQPRIAVLPLPTLPCSERLAGFAQSRYPATSTIPEKGSDTLLWRGLCKAGACAVSEALEPPTAPVFDGGSFTATSTDAPSQNSDAFMVGIHIPGVVDVASARATATSALIGERLVTQASWTAKDVCIAPRESGCTIAIRSVRQFALVERNAAGKVVRNESRTVIAGVDGNGQAAEITAADLRPGLPPIALRDNLFIRAVSNTEGCGKAGTPGVADEGGLEIFGRGSSEGPSVTLPLPAVGSATGGGVLLGGACAAGRLDAISFELPGPDGSGTIDTPGTTIVTPPEPGVPFPPNVSGPVLSGPRVVTKENVRYILRSAPAWRTAPYWASILGVLLLAAVLGYAFRASRPVAPVTATVDRFVRQFIRG